MTEQTIYALASGKGRAGVAVVRITGPGAERVFERLSNGKKPKPRRATLLYLLDPVTGERIDHALVLWMPGPNSFTGEDTLECHVHGGSATLDRLFLALEQMEDVRMAMPGEFSRRAFENGRLDLTEAEGLNDLVWAETEAQRKQALRQMEGVLGQLYGAWSAKLSAALALLEAKIDFADEDLPDEVENDAMFHVEHVFEEMSVHVSDAQRGQRIRDGFRIVILGRPNSGKSSLLNVLADEAVAIVSDVAGTTRDVISVRMDLAGYPVTLFDTAGLRESRDAIEQEGVRRARAKEEQADLRIYLAEVGDDPDDPGIWPTGMVQNDAGTAVLVVNKIDRVQAPGAPGDSLAQDAKKTPDALSGIKGPRGLPGNEGDGDVATPTMFEDGQGTVPTEARPGIESKMTGFSDQTKPLEASAASGADGGDDSIGHLSNPALPDSDPRTTIGEKGGPGRQVSPGVDAGLHAGALQVSDQQVAGACTHIRQYLNRARDKGMAAFGISALSGEGIDTLLNHLQQEVVSTLEGDGQPSLTRARHRESLNAALDNLGRFLNVDKDDPALAAEDVRLALRALGKITGQVNVEDILDIVFGEFCIGK